MRNYIETRRRSNPQIVKQAKHVEVRYEFAAYRFKKELIGVYKQQSRNVIIEAFGIMVIRITKYEGEEFHHEFDMGFLTAKNNEIYYLLGKLQAIDVTYFSHITSHIKNEATSWDDSYQKAARNQLRRELGMNNYNPLPAQKITICKPGRNINFID
jgi:hypothetical protein